MNGTVVAGRLLAASVAALTLIIGDSGLAADVPVANFDAGVVAYLEGDLETAAAHWRPLAEDGDPAAQFNLGALYLPAGQAVLAGDMVEAVWWFGLAARQGHAQAQYELAVIYRDGGDGDGAAGLTVPPDGQMALTWLTAAAGQGYGPAQADLGLVILGLGTGSLAGWTPDKAMAWQWLSLARDQGSEAATAALNDLSAYLSVDEQRAAERAAEALVERRPAGRTRIGF